MTKILLREIGHCTDAQQHAVRDIRNQNSIRTLMYNEHEITPAEHSAWLEGLRNDTKQIVFVVLCDSIVSGVVSVNNFDQLHKKSDWAFYLDENTRGGLGAALEYHLLNFVFNVLGLEKLNCEVLETNPAVVRLHKKFSFVEEGFRRDNIEKSDARIGVHLLGLTRSDWMSNKALIFNDYQKILNRFDVDIEYGL